MIFSFAACGKKIVVNKKPHVEASDIEYDESEIVVEDGYYYHCGSEYEIADLMEYLTEFYPADTVWNIVFEKDHTTAADELASLFAENGMEYTLNGEELEEETESETPEIITE